MAQSTPTISARQAAVLIGSRVGHAVTAKQVRSVARDLLPAYQDDAYTPHAYNKADTLVLLEAFAKRGARRGASIAGSGPDGKVTADDVATVLGLTDDTAPTAPQDATSAPAPVAKGTGAK